MASSIPTLTPLQFITIENQEGIWACSDHFYELLKDKLTTGDKWNKSSFFKGNVLRTVNGYKNGTLHLNDKLYVSFSSILRFSYHNKDHLRVCNRIVTEAENKILQLESTKDKVFPRNIREIYEHVSITDFKQSELEHYFFNGILDEDNIPVLYKDYKKHFTSQQWKKIIFFEYHWNKKYPDNITKTYSQVLESRWSCLQEIKTLTSLQRKIRRLSAEYVRETGDRKLAGELLYGYTIQATQSHLPAKLDQDLIAATGKVTGILQCFCSQCDEDCSHDKGLHVYIEVDETFMGKHNEVGQLIAHGLFKHKELCQEIDFFRRGTFGKYIDENKFKRLHFRDDLKMGFLQQDIKCTMKFDLHHDGSHDTHRLPCETCFCDIHSDQVHWSTIDLRKEWAIHVPLEIQILFEAFVNHDFLQRSSTGGDISDYIRRKTVNLYCIHDSLLNVTNRKYSGILQEMNTFELSFVHHNISAVFAITSQNGVSLSLNTAEKRLKASSERELCYFNTYVKKYPLSYETVTGPVNTEINLRQCYNILGMDNLVRLTMRKDPLPDEGRSNQVCTLPLTIKGLPKNHVVCKNWHNQLTCLTDTENGSCSCKRDINLTKDDVERCLFMLNEQEQAICERFKKFITFGWSNIWYQKEIVDTLRENFESEELAGKEGDELLNQSFETLKITLASDEDTEQSDDEISCNDTDLSDDNVVTEDDKNIFVSGISDLQLSDIEETNVNEETISVAGDELLYSSSSDENVEMSEDEDLINVLQKLDDQDMAVSQDLPAQFSVSELEVEYCEANEHEGCFGFKVFKPPSLLCRHPPPAVGRDDDIHKLKEVLDEVIIRTGNIKDNTSSRIMIAADHKIAANLFKLAEEDTKYRVFLPEFPLLHLRKSKIVNICSGYREAGIIHLLMYMHDDEETDWMKLINIQNIEIATRNIKRLSATLHIAFIITFMKSLTADERSRFLEYMKSISTPIKATSQWEPLFCDFMAKSSEKNATFAVHRDIMTHCDEVIALAVSERIGGPDGYNLLLGTVKEALPFSFVNGASSYGVFCIQLLTEHFKSGVFYQNMKKALFTGPHKGSSKNFALDSQREMEHKDALKGFRPRATTENVVPRMSVIDEFMEVQAKRQFLFQPEDGAVEQNEEIGFSITRRDIKHIGPTVSMILRTNVLQTSEEDNPVNAYKPDRPLLSKAILDRYSVSAAKYLIEKHLASKGLYGFSKADVILEDQTLPAELLNKVKRSTGTTVRRSVCKVKEANDSRQSREIKRKKKVIQKQKEVDCLSSEMNACQAILKPDCSKGSIQKSIGMRKAIFSILQSCIEAEDSDMTPNNKPCKTMKEKELLKILKEKNFVHICSSSLPEEVIKTVSIAIFEFAGVKFKTRAMTGTQYVKYVQNMVLEKLRKKIPGIVRMIVCEEKYQFTPDDLKAYTRESRQDKKKKESIQHLKESKEMLNEEKFDKKAIVSTSKGKSAVSKYLAEHLSALKLKDLVLDIDSELICKSCEGCASEEACNCKPYCVPVRATYGPFGFQSQDHIQGIKQRKGEAEMAQIDWLNCCYASLNPGESVLSVVTSGDIDALPIHLFAVSTLLPRNEKRSFENKVFIMLQKPYGLFDLYCITDIITLLEKTYGMHSCVKIAFALCMGGNDFIPKFHGISHQKVLSTCMESYQNELFLLKTDSTNSVTSAEVNKESYINFIKTLYCPKRMNPSKLSFDDVRQLSIKDPKHQELKNPMKWVPPQSALQSFAQLIDCQIDYLFTLGDHEAVLPNFLDKGCLMRDEDGKVHYDFGDDVKFVNKEELLKIEEEVLSVTIQRASARQTARSKRSLEYTPQKGQRRKDRKVSRKATTSTPR